MKTERINMQNWGDEIHHRSNKIVKKLIKAIENTSYIKEEEIHVCQAEIQKICSMLWFIQLPQTKEVESVYIRWFELFEEAKSYDAFIKEVIKQKQRRLQEIERERKKNTPKKGKKYRTIYGCNHCKKKCSRIGTKKECKKKIKVPIRFEENDKIQKKRMKVAKEYNQLIVHITKHNEKIHKELLEKNKIFFKKEGVENEYINMQRRKVFYATNAGYDSIKYVQKKLAKKLLKADKNDMESLRNLCIVGKKIKDITEITKIKFVKKTTAKQLEGLDTYIEKLQNLWEFDAILSKIILEEDFDRKEAEVMKKNWEKEERKTIKKLKKVVKKMKKELT